MIYASQKTINLSQKFKKETEINVIKTCISQKTKQQILLMIDIFYVIIKFSENASIFYNKIHFYETPTLMLN